MAASNINSVTLTGNLTKDPDVKEVSSGTHVCELRVAVNSSRKKDGVWETFPNYFQIIVWGKMAENCGLYLEKGSKVAIDGRLEWQMWKNNEGDTNSRVVIVANSVEFLTKKKDGGAPADDGPDF